MGNLKLKKQISIKKLSKGLNMRVPKVTSLNYNTIKSKSLVFQ